MNPSDLTYIERPDSFGVGLAKQYKYFYISHARDKTAIFFEGFGISTESIWVAGLHEFTEEEVWRIVLHLGKLNLIVSMLLKIAKENGVREGKEQIKEEFRELMDL